MSRPKKTLKRKIGGRPAKKKFYIFSEGQNTEPQYIRAYERRVSSTVLEIVCEKERGVPKTLLSNARSKKREIQKNAYIRENGPDDKVWVVFDKDDHHEVNEVLKACKAEDIEVAFSNPCFEVWLILHLCDYDRDEHRHSTQKECEKVCDGYSRKNGKLPNFDTLLSNVEDAEKRAEQQEIRRSTDGGEAPLTTVYKLTKAMRGEE